MHTPRNVVALQKVPVASAPSPLPAVPQAPPGAATAPAAPLPLSPTPLAALSVEALRARGAELSNQLESATSRRDVLAREIRRASPDARVGLEQRMGQLDQRILKLEGDISANGEAKAQAAAQKAQDKTTTSTGVPGAGNQWVQDLDTTTISVVFTLFVLCPIAIAAARLLWKRGSRPAAPAASRESELRLERVEQAVDAIAVEIERISEGQRFVTQVLSKGAQSPALGAGYAEPIKVPLNETVMAGIARKAT
jgi:hypothetical protein